MFFNQRDVAMDLKEKCQKAIEWCLESIKNMKEGKRAVSIGEALRSRHKEEGKAMSRGKALLSRLKEEGNW